MSFLLVVCSIVVAAIGWGNAGLSERLPQIGWNVHDSMSLGCFSTAIVLAFMAGALL